jgi:hypothetical protein
VDPWTRGPASPGPKMGYAERGALLHRFADLIEANAEMLALADTTDMGKPVSDARSRDVPRTAANYRFFADHARLATGDVLPMDTGHHAYTRFEPAGVVAAVAPWNFPLMLESWKVAPALAWGNTVVLKPAEDTPASAAIMARLALEAGLPPRPTWSRSAWNSAARAPTSSSTTPPWTTRSTGRSRPSSATPDRSAWPARACTSSAASTASSSTASRPRPRPWSWGPQGPGHPARPAGLTGALQEGPFVPGRHRARRRHHPHRRSR